MKELVPPTYSGVISLRRIGANENEVLFEEAFGYADIPNQRPNRLSTRFGTASAGKALVAVGILKLVEEGLISLDTPLKDIASRDGGFDLGTIPPEVTIRELLTHRSGIGDYFDCANAYIEDPKTAELYTNIYSIDAKGTGAGGAFLCLDDCLAFWQALLGGKLLAPASLKAMLSPHSREEGGDSYGLGIWLRKAPDSEERYIPYYTGSDPGATFISSYDPKDGSIATLFSNRGDNVRELEWKLREAITRE